MIEKFDIEHMSDDEIDALRASLRANPGTRRLIDEIIQSADESVEIELLGRYITSMYAQSPEAKQQAAALLREEDIEYIQTMLKHSPEWLESYRNLLAVADSVHNKPVNEPDPEPARAIAKKPWFSGFGRLFPAFPKPLRIAIPFASACIILFALVASSPAPGRLPMNSMPVMRGNTELNKQVSQQYISAIENKDWDFVAATLETLLDKGSAAERIEVRILYAEANIRNAHHSIAGVYHWYDSQSLGNAVRACDQALELIQQNAGLLQEQDSMSYTERILFNKALGLYLNGDDEESLVLLKKLIDLDGAYKSKSLQLQSKVE